MAPNRNNEDRIRYETRALLAFSTIPGWGFWTLKRAAAAGLSLHELLHLPDVTALHAKLSGAGVKHRFETKEPWPQIAERAWKGGLGLQQRLANLGAQVIWRGSQSFPRTLGELRDPPEWLFLRGDVALLSARSLAIVGTRNPTDEGLHLCWYLGEALPLFGAPTVSGLAAGIDEHIHRASLRAGLPTVAVLGNGIFRDFPAGSAKLADEIVLRGGAIVTEYLPDQSHAKENFVRRNRIQAALARALIPVEWKFPSGTAHTINYAQDLGRPLLAIYARTADLERRPELLEFRRRGGDLFAIPGEEAQLIAFVRRLLDGEPEPAHGPPDIAPGTQLELI